MANGEEKYTESLSTSVDIDDSLKDLERELDSDYLEDNRYARLIAAQNECERRLKIKGVRNKLSEEQKAKNNMSLVSGICFAGLIAATYFSGIDFNQALETEIKALNSYEHLKEYLTTFTPAMYGSIIATAVSMTKYLKHKKEYKKAKQEYKDLLDNHPVDYLSTVDMHAKSR